MSRELYFSLSPDVTESIAQRAAAIVLERMAAEPRQPGSSPYMAIREAADYLRCEPQHIYDLRSSGRLTRHGRLCSRAEIEAMVAGDCRNRVAPALPPVLQARSTNGVAR